MGPDTVVVSFLNGIDSEDTLIEILGAPHFGRWPRGRQMDAASWLKACRLCVSQRVWRSGAVNVSGSGPACSGQVSRSMARADRLNFADA